MGILLRFSTEVSFFSSNFFLHIFFLSNIHQKWVNKRFKGWPYDDNPIDIFNKSESIWPFFFSTPFFPLASEVAVQGMALRWQPYWDIQQKWVILTVKYSTEFFSAVQTMDMICSSTSLRPLLCTQLFIRLFNKVERSILWYSVRNEYCTIIIPAEFSTKIITLLYRQENNFPNVCLQSARST